MAPIWLRKHRELIPSVFVLVLRLYEFGQARNDINEPKQEELDMGPLEKEKLERMRDNELVNEVLNRKRTCSERGIKLAVVLLTSRKMLGESTLDTPQNPRQHSHLFTPQRKLLLTLVYLTSDDCPRWTREPRSLSCHQSQCRRSRILSTPSKRN